MESDEGLLYESLSKNLCMEMTKLTSILAEGNKSKASSGDKREGPYGNKTNISYSNMSMICMMLYSSEPKEDQ
jgi:hypothetical protein